jgi:catechol 2,3-dioxygenase-like lactoylglutathione lyase family enzyme
MHIDRIDHVVLTVRDIEVSCAFYHRALGMKVMTFEGGRKALTFGNQKFNLYISSRAACTFSTARPSAPAPLGRFSPSISATRI